MKSRKVNRQSFESGKGQTTFVLVLLSIFIFAVSFSISTVQAQPSSNITVDINVTQVGEITVTPTSLNWTGVVPKTAGGQRNVTIKNTGSVNITDIYSYVSTLDNESTRPYGSEQASDYSAGGLIVFQNESNTTHFSWAGRLEWNWTETINNIQYTEMINNSNISSYGFFRNASNSYVWAVNANETFGRCNETGTNLGIEDLIDDGTSGTRTPNATNIIFEGGDTQFGYFAVDRGDNFLTDQCVAVNYSCDKIFVYKHDRRTDPNFATCSNSNFVFDAQLAPNDIEELVADIYIPAGLPSGNLTQAIWYFIGAVN